MAERTQAASRGHQAEVANRVDAIDADGSAVSGTPGDWIVHNTYDALGRLIRRQLPHDLELEQVRVEEFYYDGVRRISETLTTPLFSSGGGPVGGGGGSGSQTYTDREYVWAPPPSGYVDECIAQIDRGNTVRYVTQDASYDVVAIVSPQTQSVASKVIGQYTWDPYGQVLTAEYAGLSASYNKLGHHGLFADRLDAGYQGATLAAGFLSTTHLPARIVYQIRNRTYDPSTQRWLQRDPNATGQVVLGDVTRHGGRMNRQADAIDLSLLYGDGMSLYEYARNGPLTGSDPSGLSLGLIATLVVQAIDMYDSAFGAMEEALQGVTYCVQVKAMLDGYALDQAINAHLITDWSISDDMFSYASGGGGPMGNNEYADQFAFGRRTGSPDAKTPWAPGRRHGSSTHWNGMYKKYMSLQRELQRKGVQIRPSTIRTNQALVGADGDIIRTADGKLLRPDVQFIGSDGKIYIIEIGVSQTRSSLNRRQVDYEALLGKDRCKVITAHYP